MSKPILAIISQSIRRDNHSPLKYFSKFEVVHFFFDAPYGDMKMEEMSHAIKCDNFKDLEKKLTKLNPDLIQGAEPYASRASLRISWLVMKVAKKTGRPYFFPMFENRPATDRFGPVLGAVMKYILKRYAAGAAKIFVMNLGAARNLAEVGVNPAKLIKGTTYGFWGIDTGLFKPGLTDYRLQTTAKKYILYVGRLVQEKGLAYLLAAWNSIKAKYPDIDLVFIGDGPMAEDIKGPQIQKLGQMKNVDLPPYFAHALFTVYPSVTTKRWEEQIGTVNLQSLACGTPVLTTASGAIPEYVTNEVGVLVPEKDAEALALGMTSLIEDQEKREKLAQKARPYILEHFNAQKNVVKIEEQLLKILGDKNE